MLKFILLIVSSVVALLSSVYNRTKSKDKLVLSLYILAILVFTLLIFFVGENAQLDHPFVNLSALLFYVVLVAVPPLMYIYVSVYLGSIQGTKTAIIPNFYIPIGLAIINVFTFIIVYSNTEDNLYVQLSEDVITYVNFTALTIVFLLQNVYYSYHAFLTYRNHFKTIDEFFSNKEGVVKKWLLSFILGYIVLICSLYLQQFGAFGGGSIVLLCIIYFYIAFIAYNGYNVPSFVSLIQEEGAGVNLDINEDLSLSLQGAAKSTFGGEVPWGLNEPKKDVGEKKSIKKAKGSFLTDAQIDEIWSRIEVAMDAEKVFLDMDLTIFKLAKLAGTNSKYLRFIIKEKYKENFASFVNSYRIRESQKYLMDDSINHYTIDAIGEKAGFKSKSSFYSAFKKATGVTPKKYRER